MSQAKDYAGTQRKVLGKGGKGSYHAVLREAKHRHAQMARRARFGLRKKNASGFGKAESVQGSVKVGRNESCPCGSQKKFKRCCA